MKLEFEVIMDDGDEIVFKLSKYEYVIVKTDPEDKGVMCRDNWAGLLNYFDPTSIELDEETEAAALEVLSLPESIETIKNYREKQKKRLDDDRKKLLDEELIPAQNSIKKELAGK